MKLHTVIKQSRHWTNISQTVLEMSTNNDCYEAPENLQVQYHNGLANAFSHVTQQFTSRVAKAIKDSHY